jgi:homospermidine synthase
MNPGLISIFSKYGLKKLTKEVLDYQLKNNILNNNLLDAYNLGQYNKMAKYLELKVIHCSEIDTQKPLNKINNNVLLNTWSPIGLLTEGLDPMEISIGTHENTNNLFVNHKKNSYFNNVLVIDKPGYKIKMKSVVPINIDNNSSINFNYINGRVIHHGESITLGNFLSDYDYCPTINYVYKINPITDNFFHTHSMKKLEHIKNSKQDNNWRVMNVHDDNLDGYDNCGALFIFDKNPFTQKKESFLYWTGSILDTNYTKNILKDNFNSPTTIQVMAGIMSGLSYIIENNNKGLLLSEDIPEDYIINKIKPYLGTFYSGQVPNEFKLNTDINKLII